MLYVPLHDFLLGLLVATATVGGGNALWATDRH